MRNVKAMATKKTKKPPIETETIFPVIPEPGSGPVTHVGQLLPDRRNARKHNPRNIGVITDSLQAVGAARSIVIDEADVVLAGNGVLEAAAEAGITKVLVVDADGETIVAVRRSGLTQAQKHRLAIDDNRANDLSEFDDEVMREFAAEGFEFPQWHPEEFEKQFYFGNSGEGGQEVSFTANKGKKSKVVRCPDCGVTFDPKDHEA